MNAKEIANLVGSLTIVDLTKDAFEGFSSHVEELFFPAGARFDNFYSIGKNTLTETKYDFSNGKPDWDLWKHITFQRTERKRNNGTVMMSVYFFGEMPLILDCIQGAIPLKFGYAAGKALYIVDQRGKNEWGSGTESFSWENIYIKL